MIVLHAAKLNSWHIYICNVQRAKERYACQPQYPVALVQQVVPLEQSDLGRQGAIPVSRFGGARVSLYYMASGSSSNSKI